MITNVGVGRSNGLFMARAITTGGTTLERGYPTGCDSAPDMAPGETRVGCYGFVVPAGVVLKQIELDAGKETGVWSP